MKPAMCFKGRYRVEETIADDNFLESYLAIDEQTDIRVRIDLFPTQDVPGEKSLEELERELRKRIPISHENILRLYDVGRCFVSPEVQTIWMASEYFETELLSDRIARAVEIPFKFGEILKILKGLADGLSHLHRSRLLAWSISPKKIRINSAFETKLPAFCYLSSAQWLRNGAKLCRTTGADLRYIAPEMICESGLITADEKADVYQLGVIAFELGSGTQPFDGTKETIFQMHRSEPPPDLIRSNNLPDWYDKLVLDCLAKVSVNRPFANVVSDTITKHLETDTAEELSKEVRFGTSSAIEVLFIEDNRLDQLFISRLIKSEHYPFNVMYVTTVERATRLLSNRQFDVVITDFHLPDGSALDILNLKIDTPVLVVSGSNIDEIDSKVFSAGAFDLVSKESEQRHLKRIPRLINRAVELVRLREELRQLKEGGKQHV